MPLPAPPPTPLKSSERFISVDGAIGSHELCPHLIAAGNPARITPLEFGDFVWEGEGPGGTVHCAIERKNIADMLNSLTTGRFSGHQLPGLIRTYDYCWLFLEGEFRSGEYGTLEYLHKDRWQSQQAGMRPMLYRDFRSYLTSLEVCTKLKVRCTKSPSDTVEQIGSLFRWWQKPWKDHKSFQGFHTTSPEYVDLEKPSFMRRVVKEIDGIGWDKSYAVEREFGNVMVMVMASEKEWMAVDGIGKKLATNAVKQLRGEK